MKQVQFSDKQHYFGQESRYSARVSSMLIHFISITVLRFQNSCIINYTWFSYKAEDNRVIIQLNSSSSSVQVLFSSDSVTAVKSLILLNTNKKIMIKVPFRPQLNKEHKFHYRWQKQRKKTLEKPGLFKGKVQAKSHNLVAHKKIFWKISVLLPIQWKSVETSVVLDPTDSYCMNKKLNILQNIFFCIWEKSYRLKWYEGE